MSPGAPGSIVQGNSNILRINDICHYLWSPDHPSFWVASRACKAIQTKIIVSIWRSMGALCKETSPTNILQITIIYHYLSCTMIKSEASGFEEPISLISYQPSGLLHPSLSKFFACSVKHYCCSCFRFCRENIECCTMFEPYLSKESDMTLPERFSDDWMDGFSLSLLFGIKGGVWACYARRKYDFLQEPLQFYIGRWSQMSNIVIWW